MLTNFKTLALLLTLLLGGMYAFITHNINADGLAVYKTNMFSGYDVTGILFDPNDADPTIVETITFHVTPSRGSAKVTQVKIQTESNGVWTECSLVDAVPPARVATCTFESLAAEDVTALKISAR